MLKATGTRPLPYQRHPAAVGVVQAAVTFHEEGSGSSATHAPSAALGAVPTESRATDTYSQVGVDVLVGAETVARGSPPRVSVASPSRAPRYERLARQRPTSACCEFLAHPFEATFAPLAFKEEMTSAMSVLGATVVDVRQYVSGTMHALSYGSTKAPTGGCSDMIICSAADCCCGVPTESCSGPDAMCPATANAAVSTRDRAIRESRNGPNPRSCPHMRDLSAAGRPVLSA